jgi:hypothetical protein
MFRDLEAGTPSGHFNPGCWYLKLEINEHDQALRSPMIPRDEHATVETA